MRRAARARVRVVVLVAAATCGAWLAHLVRPAAAAVADALTVGVVRQDGLLVPVARFTGGVWTAAWAAPGDASEAARGLHRLRGEWPSLDRLGATRWWLWPASGRSRPAAERLTLDLVRPVVAASHCQHLVAIDTSGHIESWRRPPPVPDRFPLEVLGLAASRPDVDVVPPRPFALQPDPLLSALAQRTFRRAEDDLLAIVPVGERVALPALAARLPTPVEWTAAYTMRDTAGARLVLAQGRVVYSDAVMTTGQVWMRGADGEWTAGGDVAIGGDGSKRGVTRVPLGALHLAGRTFVVAMAYVYGGEQVEILEWPPDSARPRVVFEQPGGGC